MQQFVFQLERLQPGQVPWTLRLVTQLAGLVDVPQLNSSRVAADLPNAGNDWP